VLSPSFSKKISDRRLWQYRQHLQLLQVQHNSPLQRTLQFRQRLIAPFDAHWRISTNDTFIIGRICKRHYIHITWQFISIIVTPRLRYNHVTFNHQRTAPGRFASSDENRHDVIVNSAQTATTQSSRTLHLYLYIAYSTMFKPHCVRNVLSLVRQSVIASLTCVFVQSSTYSLIDICPSPRVTVGNRCSATTGSRLWNSLPADVQSAPSLTIFR